MLTIETMSNVSDWAVFARVAELKSLSSAGRELRLSSAVVSNRIAKLEKEHGVRLLNRTTRRVNVTAEGQVFYEHCTRILDEIAAIEIVLARVMRGMHSLSTLQKYILSNTFLSVLLY